MPVAKKEYYDTLEDLLQKYPKKELTGREKDWSKEEPVKNIQILCRIQHGKDIYWAGQCLSCKKYSYYRANHISGDGIRCCTNNIKEGDTFGKLKILYLKERTPRKIWTCECTCENHTIKDVREDCLLNGNTISCGCYNKENNLFNIKDYTNMETEHYIIRNRTQYKASNGSYLWEMECKKCHKTYISMPTEILNGRWNPCGDCWHVLSKGEENIVKLLKEYNISYQQEYSLFRYSKSNRPCKVDFYINDEYVIEYDGLQHFSYEWQMTEEEFNYRRNLDLEKNNYCFNNNIKIIRIPYTCTNITIDMLIPEKSEFLLTKENEENYFLKYRKE